MPNEDLSKRHFQKKISTYCDVRIVPVAPHWVVDNLRAYLLALITFRKTPALANNRYDWRQIAHDCGIDEELTTALKKQLRPALDAIMRWLKEPPVEDDAQKRKRPLAIPKARATSKFAPSTMDQGHGVEEVGSSRSTGRPGPKPKPVSDKPEPLFEANEDPSSFKGALAYQMRRFGESYWQLHRAVVRIDETFDAKTLLSWIEGQRVPRSVASFDILCRIERRYGLERGYFKAKLPHQSRSLYGHDLEDISPAERRRLAWHLPDDFSSLPFQSAKRSWNGSGASSSRGRRITDVSRRQQRSNATRSGSLGSHMAGVHSRLDSRLLVGCEMRTKKGLRPRRSRIQICSPVSSMHPLGLRWKWQILSASKRRLSPRSASAGTASGMRRRPARKSNISA